jgi:hypothetical protein
VAVISEHGQASKELADRSATPTTSIQQPAHLRHEPT